MPIVTMKLRLNAREELMIMDAKYKTHASKRDMALMVLLALVSALKNVRQMRLNVMYQETLLLIAQYQHCVFPNRSTTKVRTVPYNNALCYAKKLSTFVMAMLRLMVARRQTFV